MSMIEQENDLRGFVKNRKLDVLSHDEVSSVLLQSESKVSIFDEQLKNLKKRASCEAGELRTVLFDAALSIEFLNAKLQAANMDNSGEWIPVSDRMPEEERCIDPETGYYGRSDDVLCSAYNEYEMKDEIWIDYTIDGEWQAHEYDEEEELAWMPLPDSYCP